MNDIKLRDELAEKDASPYHETKEARIMAFKNGWYAHAESLPVTGESEAIDWDQVFENAQSMHLMEFINYYKQQKK